MEITKRKIYSKIEKDDGLDGDNDVKNTLPSHLVTFFSNNSKGIMDHFIRDVNGFYNNSLCYGDTDSMYNGMRYWSVLDKTKLVAKELCQGKNDYKSGGIFYGTFLAPKIKNIVQLLVNLVIQKNINLLKDLLILSDC